jgi:hypothetical protein
MDIQKIIAELRAEMAGSAKLSGYWRATLRQMRA